MQPVASTAANKKTSPFFRDYGAVASTKASPLLSEGPQQRYSLPSQASISQANDQQLGRKSLLPNAFHSPIVKRSEDSPLPESNRSLFETTTFPNQPTRSTAEYSQYLSDKSNIGLKKIVPKSSILTVLESSSSLTILAIVILPALLTLLFFASTYSWKYHNIKLNCPDQVSQCTINDRNFVFSNITGLHSLARLSLTREEDWADLNTHSNIAVSISKNDNNTSQSIYKTQILLAPWLDGNITNIPLSYLDLKGINHRHHSHSSYSISISFQHIPQPTSIALNLYTYSESYVWLSFIMRGLLSFLCCGSLLRVSVLLSDHAARSLEHLYTDMPYIYASQFSSWHFILPEQYVICAGLGLWAVVFAHSLLPSASSPHMFYFTTLIITIGEYGLILLAAWFIDGLRYHNNAYDEKKLKCLITDTERSHSSSPSPSRVLHTASNVHQDQLFSVIHSIYNTYLVVSHPLASEFWDFAMPKLGLFTLSCFVSYSHAIYSHRVAFDEVHDYSKIEQALVLQVMNMASILVMAVWAIYLIKLLRQTGQQLSRIRYMHSRLRQISYRILSSQFLAGLALYIGMVYYILSSSLLNVLFSSLDMTSKLSMLWKYIEYCGIELFMSSYPHPVSTVALEFSIFFCSLFLATAYYLLPEEPQQESLVYLPLRKYLPSEGDQSWFCLEVACYLLEASYQAYFPHPDEVKHLATYATLNASDSKDSSTEREKYMSGPRLELSRLGLDLSAVFSSPASSTFGYIGTGQNEIVVAFRGSTSSNILTDFKFTQMPLPNLQRDLSFFMQAIYSMDHTEPLPAQPGSLPSHPSNPSLHLSPAKEGINIERDGLLQRCLSLLPNVISPRVHVGFWQSFASIRDDYMIKITQTLYLQSKLQHEREFAYDGSISPSTVFFTGHSLGGAMACLAALELTQNLPILYKAIRYYQQHYSNIEQRLYSKPVVPYIEVYSFGCPRIGSPSLANLLDDSIPSCYRVQVDGDIVSMVPKFLGFYRHVGKAVLVDDQGAGDLVLQPSALELFFFKKTTGNIANHSLEKYRLCLEACFEPGDYADYLAKEYSYLAQQKGVKASQGNNSRIPLWMIPI